VVAIDTNVLVRWLVRDDETLAVKADEVCQKARPGELYLDRLILAELTYVLRSVYGLRKVGIVLNLRALASDERFVLDEVEVVGAAIDLFEQHQPLSFEDCWLLALKQAGRATAVATFDKALANRC